MNKPLNILYAKVEYEQPLQLLPPTFGRNRMYGFYVQIDGFIDKDEFKKQIDEWIRIFRNTKPASGTHAPLIPGDPEREAEAIRSKEGIPH